MKSPFIKSRGLRSFGGNRSSPSLFAEKIPIDQQIADALLANNSNLLALICQASFVGDTAANVSLGVLGLLRRGKGGAAESFLKRLLKARIGVYLKKNRDLSDILRDNSMATILLNAFTRQEGVAYLSQSLGETIVEVLGYLDHCEIDPQRLNASMAASAALAGGPQAATQTDTLLSTELAENEHRLRRMCHFLHSAVVDANASVPSVPLLTGLSSINVVSGAGGDQQTTLKMGATSPLGARSATAADDTTAMRNTPTTTTPSTPIAQSVMSDPVSWPAKVSEASSKGDCDNVTSPQREPGLDNSIGGGGTIGLWESADMQTRWPRAQTKSNLCGTPTPRQPSPGMPLGTNALCGTPGAHPPAQPSPYLPALQFASPEPLGQLNSQILKLAISFNFSVSADSTPQFEASPGSSTASQGLVEPASPARLANDVVPLPRVPRRWDSDNVSVARTVGSLTVAEKVIGSFLFLRFFVPALTSPDKCGLVNVKISPSARRGLVLCGKLVTALCNDVEFGAKEQYLMPLNSWLKENRDKMKEFLVYASSQLPPEAPEAPDGPAEPSPLDNGLVDAGVKQSALASPALKGEEMPEGAKIMPEGGLGFFVSTSMPSLVLLPGGCGEQHGTNKVGPENVTPRQFRSRLGGRDQPEYNLSTTAGELRKRSKSADTLSHDAESLFCYLGRSIAKVERDIEELLPGLPAEETEGVVDNLAQLKKVLKMSQLGWLRDYLNGKARSSMSFEELRQVDGRRSEPSPRSPIPKRVMKERRD
ncbi:hypothetical protein SeMB42_g06060 [Synchytrium endobioticum]|uniref:Ras-GAP domain-containing protein n=1 Tax=Synchytrium endobioticum TaxID=286115 RepID=A0A507CMT3_9FUNG|nr:hypothetical protein SeMB42_g06060 [Synchytrium endobioticum]